MDGWITFRDFWPQIVTLHSANWGRIKRDYERSRLLLCGEVHGVKENCHILYSICSVLRPEVLGIEKAREDVGAFVESVIRGEPDFGLTEPAHLQAGVLSIEMAKTIYILVRDGHIQSLAFIDTVATDRECGIAERILDLKPHKSAICILGNWHVEPLLVKKGPELHRSALWQIRQADRIAMSLRYQYRRGSYRASSQEAIRFQEELSLPADYTVWKQTRHNYLLSIPSATPTNSYDFIPNQTKLAA